MLGDLVEQAAHIAREQNGDRNPRRFLDAEGENVTHRRGVLIELGRQAGLHRGSGGRGRTIDSVQLSQMTSCRDFEQRVAGRKHNQMVTTPPIRRIPAGANCAQSRIPLELC
ncbi:hypothetical protein GCM10011610_18840 [Nocardia rhizosphaerihabitans]|uniref:Uncharacterized protein n=1 Tax=Nocardia rhizosphaerihabitans TaxID=1691570 RepID=A0ABQ2KCV9_9NOCA|nr:hypothetical protein GCM10011610_18840 [Nocardia rhizosphaerihabitans]